VISLPVYCSRVLDGAAPLADVSNNPHDPPFFRQIPSMTALHPKAPNWIRQGIFDDLRSFDVFENRVNKIIEEKDRGDAFEIFIEGYLATPHPDRMI